MAALMVQCMLSTHSESTMSEPVLAQHIETTPGVCGGKPRIAGTRIRVWDVYVWHELQSRAPEQIVHDFPQLSLADVHAALAYFWDNQKHIRGQMQQAEDLVARLKGENDGGLLQRLKAKDASGDGLPS